MIFGIRLIARLDVLYARLQLEILAAYIKRYLPACTRVATLDVT